MSSQFTEQSVSYQPIHERIFLLQNQEADQIQSASSNGSLLVGTSYSTLR